MKDNTQCRSDPDLRQIFHFLIGILKPVSQPIAQSGDHTGQPGFGPEASAKNEGYQRTDCDDRQIIVGQAFALFDGRHVFTELTGTGAELCLQKPHKQPADAADHQIIDWDIKFSGQKPDNGSDHCTQNSDKYSKCNILF